MNSEQYRSFLLNSIPRSSSASGGTVVNCRCFFCPDSKNPNSKHFYISIPQNEYEPSLYYCHKCHARGIVTYKKLIEWDIYNDQIAIDLIDHNKKCSEKGNYNKYASKIHYNVNNLTTTDNEVSLIKLNYINNRIGCIFTYEE